MPICDVLSLVNDGIWVKRSGTAYMLSCDVNFLIICFVWRQFSTRLFLKKLLLFGE